AELQDAYDAAMKPQVSAPHSGPTHFNHLTITIKACGDLDTLADHIYDRLETFEDFNKGNSNSVSLLGDVATFTPNSFHEAAGLEILGYGDVSVRLSFDGGSRKVTGVTIGTHFLSGHRSWGVNQLKPDKHTLVLYTVAQERYAGPGFRAVSEFLDVVNAGFGSQVQSIWSTYLNNIVDHFISNKKALKKLDEKFVSFEN